jgi:hypothetical protein
VHDEALPTLRAHDAELEQAFGAIVKDALASDAIQARLGRRLDHDRARSRGARARAHGSTRELLVENPAARRRAPARARRPHDPATEGAARAASRDQFQEFSSIPLGELLFLDESAHRDQPRPRDADPLAAAAPRRPTP